MRKLVVASVLVVGWWWWHDRGSSVELETRPHTFVLGDRFGVVDGPDTNRTMTILDRAGERVRKVELDPLAPDIRMVGTGGGPAAVWIDAGKIVFQMIGSDGRRGASEKFGSKAAMLCEGSASNEQRFGVGWMEKDGRIWFVHGNGAASAESVAAASVDDGDADAPKPKWCGIASADEDIALVWPDGNKLAVNMCSRKRCESTVTTIKVDPASVRGFGCIYDGCLVATSDGNVSLFSLKKGKKLWTRELPGARRGERMPIAGRNGQLVVAYQSDGFVQAVRVDATGDLVTLLHADGDTPSVALARDRVIVALRHHGDVVHHVMPVM